MTTELETKLINWLKDSKIQTTTTPYQDSEFSFRIPSFYEPNMQIDVMKMPNQSEIFLLSNIRLDEPVMKDFGNLSDTKKMEFIVTLKIKLEKFDLAFAFKPSMADVQSINFTTMLYPEDITRTRFMEKLRTILYATHYLATAYGSLSLGDDRFIFP
jgi:hypothetical protein